MLIYRRAERFVKLKGEKAGDRSQETGVRSQEKREKHKGGKLLIFA